MLGRWLVIGGTVLTALIFGSIENASANWQCPVGVEPGGPNNSGVACVWIEEPQQPQYDPGSTYNPGPRVPRYIDNYIAVAWHPNATDVWATWNHRTEAKSTEKALNACTEVMGKGCTIAVNAWNASVAIARDQDNHLWQAWGDTPDNARQKVLSGCAEKKAGCQILHVFTGEPLKRRGIFTKKPKHYFPTNVKRLPTAPQADTSRGFLAIAWTGLPPQAWPNLVVASGYPTVQEAEKAAIARCQVESKQTCVSFGVVDDRTYPMFAVYLYGEKQAYWYANTTEKSLEKAADDHCREGGVTCQKIGVFDARQPGISIHPIKK
jgi:hypothetical protein